ncbi:MAG: protoporphyrinogen oxidase [Bacteroidales bacterium]|nr:protoporphyrinogen oxidase [Bacteroidales bacterium]
MDKKKVAIIGAGISGLTAAYYLKKAGIPFTVFEQKKFAGGVMQSKTDGTFLYETGPNSGVISHAELADLFCDLNGKCELELANEASVKRLIWQKGKWTPLPSGLFSAVSTPLFTLKDKFRVLLEPFRKKGNNPNENLAELVKRRLGKSFLNYAIDPFILGIYAGDPNYIVPKYALPKLYNLEQKYGSFVGGTIKKAKEPKTENDQKATRKIFSVKGGLQNLIHALVEEIGPENIQYQSDVKFTDHRFTAIKQGKQETFSHVISTGTATSLPELFPFLSESDLQNITVLKYAKVVEASIGFKIWQGIKLDAFGGLVPYIENKNILGVLFMSSLFENRAPKEGGLFTVFVGGMRKAYLADLPEDKLKAIIADDFKEMMGLEKFHPDLFELNYYNQAIAQYGSDSEARLAAITQIEKEHKGLYLAGSMRDGVGIADRVKQGKELALQIVNQS